MMIRSARCKALLAFVLAVGTLLWTGETFAAVRLPKIFGDEMVLQCDMVVPVWGWAKAGEKVTVSFAGHEKSATAGENGKWMVRLDAMPASRSPRELTVAGENTLTLKDVLVGEVWLCGGQSNMQMTVGGCLNLDAEKAAATNSTIRCFKVAPHDATRPVDDVAGQWSVCSPANVVGFTAVGYFFAREIAKALDVPVGIIDDNWGGTRIEPWTPPEGFRAVPELHDLSQAVDGWIPTTEIGHRKYAEYLASLKAWLSAAEAALAANREPQTPPEPPGPAAGPGEPTRLFNGMIAPVIPYAIRGALWYQGEANGDEGVTYLYKMKALIGGWRQLWGEGDFPFYYVQLANCQRSPGFQAPGGDGWAPLREAQLHSLAIPNTGMAVAIDIGETENIHPKDKQDVGKRLALWALARTYGKDLVFSGPLYKGHAVEGDKVRITFDHTGGGLIAGEKNGLAPVTEAKDGKLKWFAIAGEDKVWHWADAVIEGETVVVRSDKVPAPVAVRYAFAMNPEGANLYNTEGLPASPFRTDDWK
jgi:sialate O-acetylesterase